MTDQNSTLLRTSSYMSASSAQHTSDTGSVRPRNRRLISIQGDTEEPQSAPSKRHSGFLSALTPDGSRSSSPLPWRSGNSPSRNGAGDGNLGQFLTDSWTQSWSSVQGFTNSLLSGQSPNKEVVGNHGTGVGGSSTSWGPMPPQRKPGLKDVATGSLQERQAALKAAKTASVLESHDGVNGGLDITGKYKRRTSDEVVTSPSREDYYLVYIHYVSKNDTFAGLVLRYRCNEDVFRRANGLWSRDSIQTRKWLTIPVDACELRSRPCEAPSWRNSGTVDHLAPTPATDNEQTEADIPHDEYFNRPRAKLSTTNVHGEEEDKPWTHIRWVKIDDNSEPIEIGRVARGALGYFPPRRKKSIRTISSLSTPRQSLDISSAPPNSADGTPSGRLSSVGHRPPAPGTPYSGRSRPGSDAADNRPAWMRRPGGVGTMNRNTKAPGPDTDYFNTWTRKHIPGLNLESMPSMSIMGSEIARIGFGRDSPGVVESPHEEGRDTTAPSRQGIGFDRAATAVETWLRGALTKKPTTPSVINRGRLGASGTGEDLTDLIELTDTQSDDGRLTSGPAELLERTVSVGDTVRNDNCSGLTSRGAPSTSKGRKTE